MNTPSRKIAAVVSLCALSLCTAGVWAGDSPAPLQQAAESLQKNDAKNPGNAGLENAYSRILGNQRRFKEKHESAHHESSQDVRSARVERIERVERPERPERINPSVRVDRPDHGNGHHH